MAQILNVTTEIPDLLGLMFADEVSCFADTMVGLQRILNELETFCKTVGIDINFDKTKIAVHKNGGPLRPTVNIQNLDYFLSFAMSNI